MREKKDIVLWLIVSGEPWISKKSTNYEQNFRKKIYRYQTVINRIKKAGFKVLKEKSTVKVTELHMYIKRSEEHEFGRW